MNMPEQTTDQLLSRRAFFGKTLWGVGGSALASMMPQQLLGTTPIETQFAPKAKRIIYLFMSGAPS